MIGTVSIKQYGWNSIYKTVWLKQYLYNSMVGTLSIKQNGWNIYEKKEKLICNINFQVEERGFGTF